MCSCLSVYMYCTLLLHMFLLFSLFLLSRCFYEVNTWQSKIELRLKSWLELNSQDKFFNMLENVFLGAINLNNLKK